MAIKDVHVRSPVPRSVPPSSSAVGNQTWSSRDLEFSKQLLDPYFVLHLSVMMTVAAIGIVAAFQVTFLVVFAVCAHVAVE